MCNTIETVKDTGQLATVGGDTNIIDEEVESVVVVSSRNEKDGGGCAGGKDVYE